jgi:hypothetical protein
MHLVVPCGFMSAVYTAKLAGDPDSTCTLPFI